MQCMRNVGVSGAGLMALQLPYSLRCPHNKPADHHVVACLHKGARADISYGVEVWAAILVAATMAYRCRHERNDHEQ
jgi:hypothetical protein